MNKTTNDKKMQIKTEAKETLIRLLGDKTNVYVVQTHVSKSGMQRRLKLFIAGFVYNDEPGLINITYLADRILGWGMDERGLKVGGCGMDMHFHTVYTISSILYGRNEDGSYNQEGCYKLQTQSI